MRDNSNDRNGLPDASRIEEIEDKSFEADIYRAVAIALGSFRETELRQAMNRLSITATTLRSRGTTDDVGELVFRRRGRCDVLFPLRCFHGAALVPPQDIIQELSSCENGLTGPRYPNNSKTS